MAEQITVITRRRRTPADPTPARPILSLPTSTSPATVTTLTLCSEARATRQHKRLINNPIIDAATLQLARMATKSKYRQKDTKRERDHIGAIDVPAAAMPGAPKDYHDARRVIQEIRHQVANPQPFDPSPLSRRWPVFAFTATPYPLSRAAIKAVKQAAHDDHAPELCAALTQWLTRGPYLEAVKQGGTAYDLAGEPEGKITEHDQHRAAWRMVAYTVIRKNHYFMTRPKQ